jgi:hypothetical protein
MRLAAVMNSLFASHRPSRGDRLGRDAEDSAWLPLFDGATDDE